MIRKPLIAGNWKMHGTWASIDPLVTMIVDGLPMASDIEVAICAPFIYLDRLQASLANNNIALGGQNVSQHLAGAYTGEISIEMLHDMHCRYVIVGHSERRALYAETDRDVAEKFHTVVEHGLIPILCVGESSADRQAQDTEAVIYRQLSAVLNLAGIARFKTAVIAYEPIWAIGTGVNASPEQAEEVNAFIRLQLSRHNAMIADNIRLLYGGSMTADNASALLRMPNIDGGLIGGASLKAKEFLSICKAAGE